MNARSVQKDYEEKKGNNFDNTVLQMRADYKRIQEQDPKFDLSEWMPAYNKYSEIYTQSHAAEVEAAKHENDHNLPATAQMVDDEIVKLFSTNAYFSALLCQDNTTSFFTSYKPAEVYKSKKVVYKKRDNGRLDVAYYRMPTTSTRGDVGKLHLRLDEHAHPSIAMPSGNYRNKGNFYYSAFVEGEHPLKGVVEETNGSVTVMYIPIVSKEAYAKARAVNYSIGYNKAINLFDYDKIEVDVLTKDEAGAKAVNIEAKKKEMIALVQKNIKEDDKKKEDDFNKSMADTKPDPEGMKLPELNANMLSIGQKLWDGVAKDMPDGMGLTGGKLTKIWFLDNDWSAEKNGLGEILYRYAVAQAIVKTPEGKCFLYKYVFTEDYMGSATYSKALKCSVPMVMQEDRLKPIPCANAK